MLFMFILIVFWVEFKQYTVMNFITNFLSQNVNWSCDHCIYHMTGADDKMKVNEN